MNKIWILAGAAAGAVCGAVAAWRLLKQRYEDKVQEEVDSVKEVFARREQAPRTLWEAAAAAREKEDIASYVKNDIQATADLAQQLGYAEKEKPKASAPCVIPPEEFGEEEDYAQISLTYYADGVLTDENNERIEDVEECVCSDSVNHFGEYQDDSVFVRNDERRCYYEILLDHLNYSEIAKHMPHPVTTA